MNQDLCEESSMQDIPYDTSHVPIDYDDSVNVKELCNKISRKDERRERSEQRAALERDVLQLQKQLIMEVNMRNALYRGFSRPLGCLPRIYADMPVETRNLLLEVAVLEEEIVSLEKQVIHLGREIEIECMPALDKETICESPDQSKSRIKKAEIVVSPLVSPRDSARINSKASLSSSKSIDQKKNQSKPSFPAGKVLENKSSSITVSVPAPRKSLDNAGSSIKSSEPRRISTVVPHQKPQIQRNSSFPKANPRDLKSRRLSLSKKEPTVAMHTTPFIPSKISPPKEDEESTPPESTAFVSPSDAGSDIGKSYSQLPKIKTENRGKPPVTGNSRFSKIDLINTKGAPKTRTVKARGTPRPAGEDKGPLDTSRIPRHPLARDTILTRTTMSSSTATSEQRMTTNKKSSSASNTSTSLNCDSSLQKPVDAEPGNDTNNTDIPSTVREHDGDCKPIHRFPDHAKASQPNCSAESPVRDLKLGLDQVTDSVLSAEEVVKFLKTICGNLQEKQPPLASDSGSSSQTSISTNPSSASPDDFEMRGGVNINFRLDDCYTGSFRIKRSASMNYKRDCFSGEDADALDPYTYLKRENISSRTGFHQRLMS